MIHLKKLISEIEIPEVDLSKITWKQNYKTGIVYHGGRKFDKFSAKMMGTASGVKSGYFWFTDSLDNAKFYEDGAIYEGHLSFNNAALVDADDFPKMSPRQIADDITVMMYHADYENMPDGFIITNCLDGSHYSTIYAVPFGDEDGVENFTLVKTHQYDY